MSKIPKSFRLSDKAISHLSYLVELTGSNETAIVEMSLAHLVKVFADKASEYPGFLPTTDKQQQPTDNKNKPQNNTNKPTNVYNNKYKKGKK